MVGDSAVSRLYKDGIGAAYITAKACAVTALFLGVSARDFDKHYQPVLRRIARDNKIGWLVFVITGFYQKLRFLRRGMVHMVRQERGLDPSGRIMGKTLWNIFTGSASYRDILLQSMHPIFVMKLFTSTLKTILKPNRVGLNDHPREQKNLDRINP
ncbi:MAG: hypothetical protein HW380_1186 [Magnetococcales bacterium]|nr:hypothetical protein [Magnetococcales bacterium]